MTERAPQAETAPRRPTRGYQPPPQNQRNHGEYNPNNDCDYGDETGH